jgi:hypothetical protein
LQVDCGEGHTCDEALGRAACVIFVIVEEAHFENGWSFRWTECSGTEYCEVRSGGLLASENDRLEQMLRK